MATQPNELTQKISQRMSIDNMIWNLFEQSNPPLFDGGRVFPASILDEFTQRGDVLAAACNFIVSLKQIWSDQYPATILQESEIHPLEESNTEPQSISKQRTGLDNLVWSLFRPSHPPLFNRHGVPQVIIDEFTQRKDVLDAAFYFAASLTKIWNKQYPGITLIRSKIQLPVAEESKAATPQPTAKKPASTSGAVADQVANHTKQSTTQPEEKQAYTNQAEKSVPSEPASLLSRQSSTPSARTPVWKPTNPIATFQVPNARSGQAYNEKIAEVGAAPRSIQFRNVRFRTDLGLSFNESGELLGTPVVAGDHEITFQWSEDNGKSWSSGKCLLIVNPDPRSLWKIDEPPKDAPYKKDHIDKKLIPVAGFQIAAASRRGRSHEHSGTFRDDDFFVNYDTGSGWSVLIVADGAGSAKSSRWGSKLAVKAAGEHLVSNLAGDVGSKMSAALSGWNANLEAASSVMGQEFHYLFYKAASLAVDAIEAEAKSKNAPVKEYSTTLLAAAVKRQGKETFLATFWMGDGAIAAYGPRAKVRLMGAPDGGEFAGQTRFLDRAALMDKDFSKRVNIGRFPDLLSVMLMTDGISDPRFETDNGLKDAAKWDALWDEIESCLTSPKPDESLVDWLHFFTPGHHDDRTIALLW